MMESYVERPPLPGLAGVVRTVWIQRTGEAPYVQRHLPTGGVEIHFPIGSHPQLVGPLTGPEIEVIPAHTTIVGVRFQPGTAPPFPAVLDDLVDQRLGLAELWRSSMARPIPLPSMSAPTAIESFSSPVRACAKHATCAATLGWRCPSRPWTTRSSPLSSVGGSSNGSTAMRSWEIIDQLATKYTGMPYPRGQERVVVVIEPERQTVGVG